MYWNVYLLVAGGTLAFSSLRPRRDWRTTALVSVLFAAFAYKNNGAIGDVIAQQSATLKAMQAVVEADNVAHRELASTFVVPELGGTQVFHVTCDALVVAALWAMERRRRLLN
jgi:hypothetical protein